MQVLVMALALLLAGAEGVEDDFAPGLPLPSPPQQDGQDADGGFQEWDFELVNAPPMAVGQKEAQRLKGVWNHLLREVGRLEESADEIFDVQESAEYWDEAKEER